MKCRRSTLSGQRRCVKINLLYRSLAGIAVILIDRLLWDQPTSSPPRSSLHIWRGFSHTKHQRSHPVWSAWSVNVSLSTSWRRLPSGSCKWLCTSRLRRKDRERVYKKISLMTWWASLLLMCLQVGQNGYSDYRAQRLIPVNAAGRRGSCRNTRTGEHV